MFIKLSRSEAFSNFDPFSSLSSHSESTHSSVEEEEQGIERDLIDSRGTQLLSISLAFLSLARSLSLWCNVPKLPNLSMSIPNTSSSTSIFALFFTLHSTWLRQLSSFVVTVVSDVYMWMRITHIRMRKGGERESKSVKIKFYLSTPSPSQHVHGYVRARAHTFAWLQ